MTDTGAKRHQPDIRAGRLPADEIGHAYADLHPRLTDMQAATESARCLFCHDAPCVDACPTGIDIPAFIRKISTGNIKGAAIDILSENIMGGTCANACPVEELCEQVCVMNTAESKPVTIGRLQRYATDDLFDRNIQPFQRAADSGRKVAVVGAGPAGLACAHRLALYGHRIDVFDARPKAGGLNEYGLAAYKMVDDRAAKEVRFITAVGGISIHNSKSLGSDISLAELRRDYDAVFLGLGHNAVNRLGLENEEASGVYNAVDYIVRIRQEALDSLPVGRHVVVIGGGNTAIDIAVQIKKLGAEYVTLVYRRGEAQMGATDYEQALAQMNGVLIKTWAQPAALVTAHGQLSAVRLEYTELDAGGRLKGTGNIFELPADMLFKAIGQRFDAGLLNGELALDGSRIAVDENRRTSLEDVYAGGDCVPGEDLTVVAVQDGKLAAEAIHRHLMETADG